uniref:Fatty-acid and retinol-binding protein 1 n=1 Tax=Syphacia muris TaxID=451379 RepID=A0A0N5AN04_9BILA
MSLKTTATSSVRQATTSVQQQRQIHSISLTLTLLLLQSIISVTNAADVSVDIGAGAASQLVREVLHQVLSTPRSTQISLRTSPTPFLPSLAKIDAENRLFFDDVKFEFDSKLIRLNANKVRIRSISTITPKLWPMSFSDEIIHLNINVCSSSISLLSFAMLLFIDSVVLETAVDENNQLSSRICDFNNSFFKAYSSHYWLVDSVLSVASMSLKKNLNYFICPMLANYIAKVETATIRNKERSGKTGTVGGGGGEGGEGDGDGDGDGGGTNILLADSLTVTIQTVSSFIISIIALLPPFDMIKSAVFSSVPLFELLPPAYHEYLNRSDAQLYYRIRNVDIQPRHAHIVTQLEWNLSDMNSTEFFDNSSQLNIHWENDRSLAFLIDETAVNTLLEQITWDFQWMNEKISVTSPVLPTSSREFLSTLCTSCYFWLNVWAKGPPVIHATNNSITLEKRDRINLRVVNPDRNVTSVFVSMTLFINAELRPVIDSGTIRTMVQLLDTDVVMEKGAFPPAWTNFVQDLVKGMILDVMWPEMKKQIEDLTYGHGIGLTESCGVDLKAAQILIGEGQFGAKLSLVLSKLHPKQCLNDIKAALPNATDIFAAS